MPAFSVDKNDIFTKARAITGCFSSTSLSEIRRICPARWTSSPSKWWIKKVAGRTAIQEQVLQPLRACHQVAWIRGKTSERTVFTLEQFSLPEDKQLEVTLYERNGGRTLTFRVQQEDLLRAERIDNLKLRW